MHETTLQNAAENHNRIVREIIRSKSNKTRKRNNMGTKRDQSKKDDKVMRNKKGQKNSKIIRRKQDKKDVKGSISRQNGAKFGDVEFMMYI